jgi:hypothetical protein
MQYAITGSLFLILLAGAATAQERIAEQDGLGIELEELLTERGTIRFEFGTTISASSSDGISVLYPTWPLPSAVRPQHLLLDSRQHELQRPKLLRQSPSLRHGA